MAQQVAGLPDPGGGVGAGEPEPVTQPADQVRCAGAGLQVPLVGLAQQQPLQHGRVRLHLEHGGEGGLDLLVRQLPHLVCSHHGVQAGRQPPQPGDHRVLEGGVGWTHEPNLTRTLDTTPARHQAENPCGQRLFGLTTRTGIPACGRESSRSWRLPAQCEGEARTEARHRTVTGQRVLPADSGRGDLRCRSGSKRRRLSAIPLLLEAKSPAPAPNTSAAPDFSVCELAPPKVGQAPGSAERRQESARTTGPGSEPFPRAGRCAARCRHQNHFRRQQRLHQRPSCQPSSPTPRPRTGPPRWPSLSQWGRTQSQSGSP